MKTNNKSHKLFRASNPQAPEKQIDGKNRIASMNALTSDCGLRIRQVHEDRKRKKPAVLTVSQ
jgi:hypothetical protein